MLAAVTQSIAERYIELGLELDRHVDGIVDAYFGRPELAEAVNAAPPPAPATLVANAGALLDELDDGWLHDQVTGLHTYARIVAGESVSFADEGEGCYGYRPTYTDESVFEESHRQLDELLPGSGRLHERFERWRQSGRVPEEQIEPVLTRAIAEARRLSSGIVDLPDGEEVELELVRDVAWLGFNRYLGNYRARISVNVDLPHTGFELLRLAIHETYPGHQTERACKEQLLVREQGRLEETIVMVPAPQSLLAEGIAEVAPGLLLDGEAGAALAGIVHDAGLELDL